MWKLRQGHSMPPPPSGICYPVRGKGGSGFFFSQRCFCLLNTGKDAQFVHIHLLLQDLLSFSALAQNSKEHPKIFMYADKGGTLTN